MIADNESVTYAQLSYLNGLVKFDLTTGKIGHTLEEPLSEFAKANYPTKDDYPHNGAHHGLALSSDGEYLCDAGTIDNNVAIVLSRRRPRRLRCGNLPTGTRATSTMAR